MEEIWPEEAAAYARQLHGMHVRGLISASEAVQQIKEAATGTPDAWNLWLDVCEEADPLLKNRKRRPKNPDGLPRESRVLPPKPANVEEHMSESKTESNGTETPNVPKRRGGRPKGTTKKPKEAGASTRRVWDLVLSGGKMARLELPTDFNATDLEAVKLQIDAIQLQVDAIQKLLEVQEGIRAEAG
jgi:hypothetical protein